MELVMTGNNLLQVRIKGRQSFQQYSIVVIIDDEHENLL